MERLYRDAIEHKPTPTYPKVGTIKAMTDLGTGWHTYTEIQRELGKLHRTGNVYVFQLARLYPELVEVSSDNKARIKPQAFSLVRKSIDRYARSILTVIEANKTKT